MRKALLFVVVLALAVSVAGCASSSTTSTSQNSTSTSVASVTGPGDSTNPGATTGASDTTTSDESQAVTTEPPTTLTAETTTTSLPSSSATVTHEQNDSRFLYYGGWKTSSASGAAGGSYAVASSSGESLTIHFIGTHFAWIAKVGPTLGEAKVTVDGGTVHIVDLYSKTVAWKHTVWQSGTLKKDAHSIVISYTGKKNAKSTGKSIDVDAISITGVATGHYQQGEAKFQYAGSWKKSAASAASGGSFVVADAKGAAVTIYFSGIDLAWIAKKGPGYGEAKVAIDGGKAVTVDLYSSGNEWQKRVWSTGILADTKHVVRIEWTGTKHKGATAAAIDVDAIEVTGTLD